MLNNTSDYFKYKLHTENTISNTLRITDTHLLLNDILQNNSNCESLLKFVDSASLRMIYGIESDSDINTDMLVSNESFGSQITNFFSNISNTIVKALKYVKDLIMSVLVKVKKALFTKTEYTLRKGKDVEVYNKIQTELLDTDLNKFYKDLKSVFIDIRTSINELFNASFYKDSAFAKDNSIDLEDVKSRLLDLSHATKPKKVLIKDYPEVCTVKRTLVLTLAPSLVKVKLEVVPGLVFDRIDSLNKQMSLVLESMNNNKNEFTKLFDNSLSFEVNREKILKEAQLKSKSVLECIKLFIQVTDKSVMILLKAILYTKDKLAAELKISEKETREEMKDGSSGQLALPA